MRFISTKCCIIECTVKCSFWCRSIATQRIISTTELIASKNKQTNKMNNNNKWSHWYWLIGFGINLLENAKILFKYIINRACSLSRHQCCRIHSTEYIYSFCDRFSPSQLLAATAAQKDKVVKSTSNWSPPPSPPSPLPSLSICSTSSSLHFAQSMPFNFSTVSGKLYLSNFQRTSKHNHRPER